MWEEKKVRERETKYIERERKIWRGRGKEKREVLWKRGIGKFGGQREGRMGKGEGIQGSGEKEEKEEGRVKEGW